MDKEIKRIITVLTAICILFVSLMAYLTYFQIFKAESVKMNSYNKRLWINEEKILRGSIIDRNGKILAYSEKVDDTYKRFYNYGNLYSHIIGYSYREYGKAGLELEYNNTLLNISESTALNELKNIVLPNTEGNTLKLTIDHHLQEYSRNLLKGHKGSIVAMNPTTGEIYAMVSLPDFNPTNLKEDWKNIVEDENSPLLNRATSGLYTPGSTFKVLTAIAAIEKKDLDREYECTGSANIDGYILKDYDGKPHGKLNLEEALVKSCNTYFGEKGVIIGKDALGEVAERFLVNKKIDFATFWHLHGRLRVRSAVELVGCLVDRLCRPCTVASTCRRSCRRSRRWPCHRVVDLVAVTVDETFDLVLDPVECAHGVSRVLDLQCV